MTIKHRQNKQLQASEFKHILRELLPPGYIRLRNYIRYRRWFPQAFVAGNCSVSSQAHIGEHCALQNCTIGSSVSLGDFSTISKGTSITGLGEIKIGRFCSIGGDCYFRSDNHNVDSVTTFPLSWVLTGLREESNFQSAPIQVGNDVWVGARVIVLAGASIGDGCIVAAGSVVVDKNYPPYSLLAGSPAKVIRERFTLEERERLLLMKWWQMEPEKIFGELRDMLESPPGKKR
jgi:virginiamycin A acetyltransferase